MHVRPIEEDVMSHCVWKIIVTDKGGSPLQKIPCEPLDPLSVQDKDTMLVTNITTPSSTTISTW